MNLWEQILARVETKVNRHSFYTWFKPTTFIAADSRTISVRVPNPLFKDWLTKHYSGGLSEAMSDPQKANLDVTFIAEAQADSGPVVIGGDEFPGATAIEPETLSVVEPGP